MDESQCEEYFRKRMSGYGKLGGKVKSKRKRRSPEHYRRTQQASTESRNAKNGYKSIDEIIILSKSVKLNSPQVEEW